MSLYRMIVTALFPYRVLDQQIFKLRKLKQEYEAQNRAYYGEYLSKILFD